MYYLDSPMTSPYENLALEEYLLDTLPRGTSCLLLWRNENAVVLGRYQNAAEELDSEYVERRRIRVARRLTGGGAVYHDLGNLNYTILTDRPEDPEGGPFRAFIRPVLRVLASYGIAAEFTGRNDLTIQGKKFSGSAQLERNGRVLHHGCIMLDSDLSAVAGALRVRAAKFQSKSVKSVASRVTTIQAWADSPISMEAFKRRLTQEVLSSQDTEPLTLSEDARRAVRELAESKYASWEWIYGRSPDYEMQREERFSFGTVSVRMNAVNARIRDIRIFGDFFGGDLHELEERLTGLALDGGLRERLEAIPLSHYIHGMTAQDLCRLLR